MELDARCLGLGLGLGLGMEFDARSSVPRGARPSERSVPPSSAAAWLGSGLGLELGIGSGLGLGLGSGIGARVSDRSCHRRSLSCGAVTTDARPRTLSPATSAAGVPGQG
eukprot:scaffold64022_cov38-Phaeocystis_antarctica.AAC.2